MTDFPCFKKKMQNAKFAAKTKTGTSKQISTSDVIMQGTVWGSLCCISTIDTLAHSMPELLYQYKGTNTSHPFLLNFLVSHP